MTDAGIEYQTLFGKTNFLNWAQVRQADYTPNNGRMRLYLHDKALPLQFGRHDETKDPQTDEVGCLRFLKAKVQSSGGSVVEQQSPPWWRVRII